MPSYQLDAYARLSDATPASAPQGQRTMAITRSRIGSSDCTRIASPGFARRILLHRSQTASTRATGLIPAKILEQKTER
jgi:hypothetical protein